MWPVLRPIPGDKLGRAGRQLELKIGGVLDLGSRHDEVQLLASTNQVAIEFEGGQVLQANRRDDEEFDGDCDAGKHGRAESWQPAAVGLLAEALRQAEE